MCAGSDAVVKNKQVSVYMGYYGGKLSIDDVTYNQNGDQKEIRDVLDKFNKRDLINLLLDLIDNSDE